MQRIFFKHCDHFATEGVNWRSSSKAREVGIPQVISKHGHSSVGSNLSCWKRKRQQLASVSPLQERMGLHFEFAAQNRYDFLRTLNDGHPFHPIPGFLMGVIWDANGKGVPSLRVPINSTNDVTYSHVTNVLI